MHGRYNHDEYQQYCDKRNPRHTTLDSQDRRTSYRGGCYRNLHPSGVLGRWADIFGHYLGCYLPDVGCHSRQRAPDMRKARAKLARACTGHTTGDYTVERLARWSAHVQSDTQYSVPDVRASTGIRPNARPVFMDHYLTASDLSRIYHVALGTIYSWASRDNWRRTDTWPRRYHWEDAQASYDRRHEQEVSP